MKRKEKRGAIGVLLRWAKMLKKKAQEELKGKLEEMNPLPGLKPGVSGPLT
jgi:hypothetical protein